MGLFLGHIVFAVGINRINLLRAILVCFTS